MSITLENSTDTVKFAEDTALTRDAPGVLSTSGKLMGSELHATGVGVRFPDSTLQTTKYVLPVATGSTLGGVKQGSGVTIAGDGTISSSGGGGGAPTGIIYDCVSRYNVVSTANIGTWLTTSAPVHYGLTWSRTGTSLTITETAHGHAAGDMVISRNTNVGWQSAVITSVTTDSFTFAVADSGPISGTAAAYSMGYTFAHVGAYGAITGGTITAPAGSQDVQLLTIHAHLGSNTRTGSTFDFTIPTQPQGAWTGNDNLIVPSYSVRQDNTNLTGASIGIASSVSGNWQVFRMSAMTPTTTGFHVALVF